MRLAPVPLFFAASPAEAIDFAGQSSRTTHAHGTCVDACRYMAGLIVGAVAGVPKEQLLSERYSPLGDGWRSDPLAHAIDEIAAGSFKRKEPPAIAGTGFVVRSLEAALWAFHGGGSFREGALLAVNLGDDADTTGAIFGQIAGAYYGGAGIPESWQKRLALREIIERMAERLLAAGGSGR